MQIPKLMLPDGVSMRAIRMALRSDGEGFHADALLPGQMTPEEKGRIIAWLVEHDLLRYRTSREFHITEMGRHFAFSQQTVLVTDHAMRLLAELAEQLHRFSRDDGFRYRPDCAWVVGDCVRPVEEIEEIEEISLVLRLVAKGVHSLDRSIDNVVRSDEFVGPLDQILHEQERILQSLCDLHPCIQLYHPDGIALESMPKLDLLNLRVPRARPLLSRE